MIKCFKESFNYTNKYIILATPLILFSLLSSLYLLFSLNGNLISMLIAVVLFFLMLSAFLSGWLYMTSNVIKNEDREDPNSLLKEFPSGVGEYMLPTIGMLFNTFIVITLIMVVSYIIGLKFIGSTGIAPDAFSKAMTSITALKTFVSSLSSEQLTKLNYWNLLIFFTMVFTYYVLMFYAPAVFFKTKNPFKGLFISIKDVLTRHFFKNILLFLILFTTYFVISVFSTIFQANAVLYFVFTLINFYYLVLAVLFLFNYYYTNYVKIGSNVDMTV